MRQEERGVAVELEARRVGVACSGNNQDMPRERLGREGEFNDNCLFGFWRGR